MSTMYGLMMICTLGHADCAPRSILLYPSHAACDAAMDKVHKIAPRQPLVCAPAYATFDLWTRR